MTIRRILVLKKKHGAQVQQETVKEALAHTKATATGAAPVTGEVDEVSVLNGTV